MNKICHIVLNESEILLPEKMLDILKRSGNQIVNTNDRKAFTQQSLTKV